MKLVLYNDFLPGVIKDGKIVDITNPVANIPHIDGQTWMSGIIENFDSVRASIEKEISDAKGFEYDSVRLRAPLPEPTRLLCMAGNYLENGSLALVGDRDAFLKSPSSVIGPGDTVVLPDAPVPHFHHESELGIVIGKTADHVSSAEANNYIFGYVNFIDVSARGLEPNGQFSYLWQKSWDTFGPMGPAIVTKDEIEDAQDLRIRLWVNGEIRQDLSTSDMGRTCEEVVEFGSWIMTLKPGDVVSTGTNHVGLSPIQDGDVIDMETENLGKLTVTVQDDWKREWPRKPLSEMTAFESTAGMKIRR